MSGRRLALVFLVALALMLIVALPLKLALDWTHAGARGLTADRASGAVWSGTLHGAALRGLRFGDVALSLDPLGLALGGGRFRFGVDGPLKAKGVVLFRGSGFGLADVDLSGPAATLAEGLPFTGQIRLENLSAEFRAGECRRAEGRISIERIAIGTGVMPPNLVLAGVPACRDGAWIAPLTGQAPGVNVEADLRIGPQGRYRLHTRARTTNPTYEAAMGLAGFERDLDGFSRIDQGRLGGDAVR